MDVTLYGEGYTQELYAHISADLEFNLKDKNGQNSRITCIEDCLCQHQDLTGVDIAIIHPYERRMNEKQDSCWTLIKQLISQNKRIQFYLFTMNGDDREKYFGKLDNMVTINHSNQSEFFENPSAFIKKHYEAFQAKSND